jgi:hypothetical protein
VGGPRQDGVAVVGSEARGEQADRREVKAPVAQHVEKHRVLARGTGGAMRR